MEWDVRSWSVQVCHSCCWPEFEMFVEAADIAGNKHHSEILAEEEVHFEASLEDSSSKSVITLRIRVSSDK